MIQEKDFLYRVPVKTAPITTPKGQIRNPEILVDIEGGEFMHGNILDANSTNKLINQSVKEAVDNKLIESGYVTKDLLDAETTRATEQENNLKTLIGAETSARTNSDEDLNAKIKAEQTRAEGKEKEISDKLAIVDGDSNTEGSFRKAIADVIAAAPEDLDTLKEIADKLADNDDLYTVLNQAITEKADASALANYVLTTALNQQVDTLNAAINAKQDAGNYIPYDSSTNSQYSISKNLYVTNDNHEGVSIQSTNIAGGNQDGAFYLDYSQLHFVDFQNKWEEQVVRTTYSINGITSDKYNDCLATSDGTFKPISDFVLKTELPEVDTSDFISKTTTDDQIINSSLGIVGGWIEIAESLDEDSKGVSLAATELSFSGENILTITNEGIYSDDNNANHVFATNGSIADLTQYATTEALTAVEQKVDANTTAITNVSSTKQNKITVNSVDVTDIETADIAKLRTIVKDLLDALSKSGLIRRNINLG